LQSLYLEKSCDCGVPSMTAESFEEATVSNKKKAKGKSKARVKSAKGDKPRVAVETEKDDKPTTTKTTDPVEVRQNIKNLVENSAVEITSGVIKKARDGQLAAAKYLFEVAGLHPSTEETRGKPEEDSVVHGLWKRIGLPVEPKSALPNAATVDATRAEKLDASEVETVKTGRAEEESSRN
jgi:hypothetical protein